MRAWHVIPSWDFNSISALLGAHPLSCYLASQAFTEGAKSK